VWQSPPTLHSPRRRGPELAAALDQGPGHRGPRRRRPTGTGRHHPGHRCLGGAPQKGQSRTSHPPGQPGRWPPPACRYVLVFNGENLQPAASCGDSLKRTGATAFASGGDTSAGCSCSSLWQRRPAAGCAPLYGPTASGNRQETPALLARDPYAIKPLYLAGPGGELFCSLGLRALLDHGGGCRAVSIRGVESFLAQGSLPAERTLWKGVRPCRRAAWDLAGGDRMAHPAKPLAAGATHRKAPAFPTPDLVAIHHGKLLKPASAHLLADVAGWRLFLSGGLEFAAVHGACEPSAHPRSRSAFAERAFDDRSRPAGPRPPFSAEHHVLPLGAAEAWRFLPGFLAAHRPQAWRLQHAIACQAAPPGWPEGGCSAAWAAMNWFGGYRSFARVPSAWGPARRLDPLAAAGAAC